MRSVLKLNQYLGGWGSRTSGLFLVVLLPLGLGSIAWLSLGQLGSGWAQEEPGKPTSVTSPSKDLTFPGSSATTNATESQLLREGTKIVNQPAICRSSGDRLQVILDQSSMSVIALENLAAQRILKASLDDASDDRWVVNGQMTEFQGHNFILLDRVTRQPKP